MSLSVPYGFPVLHDFLAAVQAVPTAQVCVAQNVHHTLGYYASCKLEDSCPLTPPRSDVRGPIKLTSAARATALGNAGEV